MTIDGQPLQAQRNLTACQWLILQSFFDTSSLPPAGDHFAPSRRGRRRGVRWNYQSHFVQCSECSNLKYYESCKFLANYNQKKDKVTVGAPLELNTRIASAWIGLDCSSNKFSVWTAAPYQEGDTQNIQKVLIVEKFSTLSMLHPTPKCTESQYLYLILSG